MATLREVRSRSTETETAEEEHEEPSGQENRRRSTFDLIRDAVLSLTRIAEDSTELIVATVREEIARFQANMVRHALSVGAIAAGAALVTAGLLMFVSELLSSWPVALVLFGVLYLGIGFLLQRISDE